MCRAYMTLSTAMASVVAMAPMMLAIILRMVSVSQPLHYGIEATVWPNYIVHYPNGTVSLFEGIWSFHMMPIPVFILFFLITSVRVVNRVVKVIMSWTLCNKKRKRHKFTTASKEWKIKQLLLFLL